MNFQDRFDPNWDQARHHGVASKAGIVHNPNKDSIIFCECCFNAVYKDPISLWQNSKSLEFLGFGFPLFYAFLKNCIVLLLGLVCTYSAFAIKSALVSNSILCGQTVLSDHGKQFCHSFMIMIASIQSNVNEIENLMRIVSFCFHLCLLAYIRDSMIKLSKYYDERNISLSDYAIIMKNIPKCKGIKQKLKQFFMKEFKEPHEIKQITLISEHHSIEELQKQKQQMMAKLRTYYQNEDFGKDFSDLQKKIEKIDEKFVEQADKLKKMVAEDQLQCEKAILLFNTDYEKEQILQNFKLIKPSIICPYFGIGGQNIQVQQAPEPKQILWENIHIPTSQKIVKRILGWVLSILLLVFATIIFYYIVGENAQNMQIEYQQYEKNKNNAQELRDFKVASYYIYIMMFVIILFNKLVMVVLFHKFTDLQGHDTMSKFQFSFALKYCLGLFFTTALMTLAVEAIKFKNYYQHPIGVIQEETIMFFMNALFVPFFWLVNPFHLLKILERKMKFGAKSLTQAQANHLMQDTPYEMGKRYAQVIQTMWFTFLYARLIPVGALISTFGIIIYYWVDKYNLLRRSAVTMQVSPKLAIMSLKLLDFTLIFLPLGTIIFDIHIRQCTSPSSIVMTVIAAIYIILPINSIIDILNGQEFNLQEKTYDQVKDSFVHTYRFQHPIIKITNEKRLSQKSIESIKGEHVMKKKSKITSLLKKQSKIQ